jgi:hypothetical protein
VPSARARWLALTSGCGVAVAACVVGLLVTQSSAAPDGAQVRAMLPVIEAYLDKDAGHLGFGHLRPALKPRVLCEAHILAITPEHPRFRVSMVMNCGEFARRAGTLIEGSAGYPGIGEAVTLAGGPRDYRVLSLLVGPPNYDQAWADRNLSPSAAAQVLSANPPTAPDPIRRAWRVFGFPPGTRAVQG